MLKKHWGLRIVLGVAAGFIISVMLCFILIFIGYTTVYRGNLSEYHVNIFGLPIYDIAMQGSKAQGTAFSRNMGIANFACIIITVIVVEVTVFIKGKK